MSNQSGDPRAGNAFVNGSDNSQPREQKELAVFEGVGAVTKKEKTGFAKWFSEMFWSGRTWKEVWIDQRDNHIVPEGKDILFNAVVGIISSLIYREPTAGGGGYSSGSFIGNVMTRYVDYNKMSTSGTKNQKTQEALAANKEKDKEIMKTGYELPTFPNYQSAKAFLDSMKAEAIKYEEISVYDMSWKRGKTIDWGWEEWGWNKDEILSIKEPSRFRQPIVVEDGKGNKIKMTHYIDMPPHHELKG